MAQKKTLGLRKNLKEQERREAIINSAIKVFARKGYDRATMDDLVSEAGCSKALIYLYWKNKAELFTSILELIGKKYSDLFHSILDSSDSFPDKLKTLISQFLELLNGTMDQIKVTFHGSLHIGSTPDEDFRGRQESIYKDFISTLAALFQQGVDRGYLEPSLHAEALAFMTVAAVEGYIYMNIFGEQMPLERALIDPIMRFVLPVIMKKEQ
jgi:AcrR family transcriptional regulator